MARYIRRSDAVLLSTERECRWLFPFDTKRSRNRLKFANLEDGLHGRHTARAYELGCLDRDKHWSERHKPVSDGWLEEWYLDGLNPHRDG